MRGFVVPVVLERARPGTVVKPHAVASASSSARPLRGAFPPLLAGLIDDAALFPPGNAVVDEAVPEHASHRRAWYAPLVGPFLLPAGRIAEVAAAATAVEHSGRLGPLAVAAVCRSADEVSVAVEAVGAAGGTGLLQLVAIEAAAGPKENVGDVLASLRRLLTADQRACVEVAWQDADWCAALDALQQTPYSVKLRTGGTVAEAFPDEQTVAAFLVACSERNLRLKCTAGLHSAVRHRDPGTAFEHHGFLNVLTAAAAAASGAAAPDVTEVLAERSEQVLVTRVLALGNADVSSTRRLFTSYGSCSIAEPLGELVRLRLLDR